MKESEIIRLIDRFCDENPGAEYTFGHVVLGDYNIEEHHIFECFSMENMRLWIGQAIDDYKDGHLLIDQLRLNVKAADFLDKLREIVSENEIEWDIEV